jgi:lipoprotein-anchoring transpeptidase ErfK/SrfK
VLWLGFAWLSPDAAPAQQQAAQQPTTSAGSSQPITGTAPAKAAAVLPAKTTNRCANNTLDKLVLINVSQRHLWACEGNKTVHDTPVVTGMLAHPSTLTPSGNYQVYAKTTDTTLTGNDEVGSWSRPVHYWMPFLDNEHGTYGFHDATWRPDKEFGAIDPNSDQASHGCVELPLASMEWLYNWAPVATTLTVES